MVEENPWGILKTLNIPAGNETPSGQINTKNTKNKTALEAQEILNQHPELKTEIITTLNGLERAGLSMPIVHFTTQAIVRADGSIVSTGFVENILREGLKARDTNVGAFIQTGNQRTLAAPSYFIEHPDQYVVAVKRFMERYLTHGLRTNKASLRELRDAGVGVPAMVIADQHGLLQRGTDYEDHYILRNPLEAKRIMGVVSLNGRKPHNPDDIQYTAHQILNTTNHYVQQLQEQL